EDALPLFLPPLARRQRGRATFHFARERERRAPYPIECPAPFDPHEDVHAARAGRLRPSRQPDFVEYGVNDAGHFAHPGPLDSRHRIEIDAQFVWMNELVGADWMWMERQTREVCHPRRRGGPRRHAFEPRPARRETECHGVEPLGPLLRRTFLIEVFAADAVWIPDQHVRPSASSAERPVGYGEVVADETQFGVTGLREEHFARVGDRHL